MKKIGLWTSGWGQTSVDLIKEVYRNFPEKISYVFLSREEGETYFSDLMIQTVRELRLPLITFSSCRFKPELIKGNKDAWRLEHDREIMKLLPPADLIVLLGYMRVISQEVCQKQIIINLHPALPDGPRGTYREVIWELIKNRASETGVMMHLVTPVLDGGPPITFCRFSIRGDSLDSLWEKMERGLEKESIEEIIKKEGEKNSLFAMIRQKGKTREFPMVIWTIKAFLEGKVGIKNGKVFNAEGKILEGGCDLTSEIRR